MRTLIRSLALFALLVPPLLSYAYPPPCKRGDTYVGGSDTGKAQCIERKYIKLGRALQRERSGMAQRRLAPPATRRTQSEVTRKVYLHPVLSRGERAELVKKRNVQLRKHAIKVQTVERSLRPYSFERGKSMSALRQDRRPAARLSRRSKYTREQRMHEEKKALRRGM